MRESNPVFTAGRCTTSGASSLSVFYPDFFFPYRSMLRLKDLKLEDSGEYRAHVDNGEQEHWENLTLIVTVRPTVVVSVVENPENGLYLYAGQYTLRYV